MIVDAVGGQNALARRTKLSQSGIGRLLAGGEPTLSTLKAIANASDRSLLWLATGEGPDDFSAVSPDDVTQIPILDVRAGAGSGVANDGDSVNGYLPFSTSLLRHLGIKAENVRAVRAGGDSMEHTITDGRLVAINAGSRDLRDGYIYALRGPSGLRIKRVQRQNSGGVILISDNRDLYPPEHLSPEEAEQIDVVGRVFWTERLL